MSWDIVFVPASNDLGNPAEWKLLLEDKQIPAAIVKKSLEQLVPDLIDDGNDRFRMDRERIGINFSLRRATPFVFCCHGDPAALAALVVEVAQGSPLIAYDAGTGEKIVAPESDR
jgi:hypothetical protein